MRVGAMTALAATVLLTTSLAAVAQAPPVQRVRGTVAAATADSVTVQTDAGGPVTIKLAPNWTVSTVSPIKLDAIKPNDYLGVGAMGPDSHLVAIQVVVLPEAARGAGEGHYPWSAQPENSMTNGTVEGSGATASGNELTLVEKGNRVKITVPPGAAVLTAAAGDKALVAPGAKVQVTANKAPDGTLSATRLTVAINGAEPPI